MSLTEALVSGSSGEYTETLLAEELSEGTGGYARGPERLLMSALLFDGVMAYMGYVTARTRSAAKRYREAYNWVHANGTEYVFSFESVCEGLGINCDALRIGLINAARSRGDTWKRSRRKDTQI